MHQSLRLRLCFNVCASTQVSTADTTKTHLPLSHARSLTFRTALSSVAPRTSSYTAMAAGSASSTSSTTLDVWPVDWLNIFLIVSLPAMVAFALSAPSVGVGAAALASSSSQSAAVDGVALVASCERSLATSTCRWATRRRPRTAASRVRPKVMARPAPSWPFDVDGTGTRLISFWILFGSSMLRNQTNTSLTVNQCLLWGCGWGMGVSRPIVLSRVEIPSRFQANSLSLRFMLLV